MNPKEKRITEVAEQYPSIPQNLFAPAIDAAGLVDSDYLAGIVSAYQAGSEGRVARQAGEKATEIRNLQTAYSEARSRGDNVAMIGLKRRVFELGGTV